MYMFCSTYTNVIQILAGCGMQNISEVWKQFVENDEVFNQYSAVCVPYLARMLEVNITVFAYPSKECVSFNYDDSGDDVTITLCFYDDKFVQLVPSSGNVLVLLMIKI